jgi:hypothetical protein
MPASAGRAPGGRIASRAGGRGQVLVIFALSITVLFAAAGLAFDIGRFYSERRFLQNAADAAALAAANAVIRGETLAQADTRARESLALNFAHSPSGVSPSLPPPTGSEVYASGHSGQPAYLINGILIDPPSARGEIRVAVQNSVGYTFGRIVGLDQNQIGGQARVKTVGNMMPIAVRRFVNLPGPNPGIPPVTCPQDQTQFMDFFATANTSCLGSETDTTLRTAPGTGLPFDPINDPTTPGGDPGTHGPLVAILGQGAQPSNGADFRGFIVLDVRNFNGLNTQLYYNGVTASTGSSSLKDMEANWITIGGYPGPMFPPATTPPDPNDQVGTMSGNDAGIVIDEMMTRFTVGKEIMVAVYPGNVMAIPDFSITPPATIALLSTGVQPNAGSLKASANQQFVDMASQVTLTTVADAGDTQNPMVTGKLLGDETSAITYVQNPVMPTLGSGQSVNLTNITTVGAPAGIYTLWVHGEAGAPYVSKRDEPFAINVGGVSRDFTITADASVHLAANAGDTVAFALTLKRTGGAFGGNVNLSLDGPLPTGIGATSFSPSAVTPSNGNSTDSTLTINTGTMVPGRHRIVVRATGMNGDPTPHKVTHLLQLWVDVATGGSGNDEYVDLVGFAIMRIASMNSNSISAYAITPVIADPNDYRLRRGQVARLVPWN